jgi:hypothetical protein
MSIEVEVVKKTVEMPYKELTKVELIKKFNMIVLALEKTKVRFSILEFVNEKDGEDETE